MLEEIFCTVEVDSFGHFFLKAKTTRVMDLEPEWNEVRSGFKKSRQPYVVLRDNDK